MPARAGGQTGGGQRCSPEGNAVQAPARGWTCGLGKAGSSEESGEERARPLRVFKDRREPKRSWDGRGSLYFQKLPEVPPL